MKLLITGGAGFIGSNLATRALADPAISSVVVIDDLSSGNRSNLADLDIDFHEASILDEGGLATALRDVDAVVHLAAIPSVPRSIKNPLASHEANATGTLRLLEACRTAGVNQIVGASSSSVYGSNPAMPKTEREWVRPLSPYAVSKLATEQYLLAYQSSYGLSTLPFRFFNVYGPGQPAGHAYAAVIPAFLDALLHDRPLQIFGDGTQSRDFTFVGTVCNVLLEAVTSHISSPEPVNLAFGDRTDLLDLAHRLETVTGKKADIQFLPAREGDVLHSQADNTSLTSLFPAIKPIELDQGLTLTAEWFKTNL